MSLPNLAIHTFNVTLPSNGQEIECRPYLVDEEKSLLMAAESKDAKEIENAIRKLVNSCTFGVLDYDNLPSFDIEYLFLKIRGQSVSPSVDVFLTHNVEECMGKTKVNIDISTVEAEQKEGHVNKVDIGESIGVKMKYPTPQIAKKLEKYKSSVDKEFYAIIHSIDVIYDAETVYESFSFQELEEWVKKLSSGQFKKLRHFFETMPRVRKEVTYQCSKCGEAVTINLEGIKDFFA